MKKHESGRSMVEMLGVLAIIGVLSVGGIAGYSLSMRRHRANQIVDVVTKYGILNYALCQQKVLNGEAKYSYSDIPGCETDKLPKFVDSNLGPLPAGITQIEHNYVERHPDTDVDTVFINIVFSDHKLCQAVAAVSNQPCDAGDTMTFYVTAK